MKFFTFPFLIFPDILYLCQAVFLPLYHIKRIIAPYSYYVNRIYVFNLCRARVTLMYIACFSKGV